MIALLFAVVIYFVFVAVGDSEGTVENMPENIAESFLLVSDTVVIESRADDGTAPGSAG